MYFYPEDIKEMALALRVEASKHSEVDQFNKYLGWAESLERIADEAVYRYGRQATVSIDLSAARGYAIPQVRS